MNTQLKDFDESYKWWGDFLEARKEALFAMQRLGFSYAEMQAALNFNWEVLLPEHDSVIVLEELEGVALQYMKDAYHKVMGSNKFCYVEKK